MLTLHLITLFAFRINWEIVVSKSILVYLELRCLVPNQPVNLQYWSRLLVSTFCPVVTVSWLDVLLSCVWITLMKILRLMLFSLMKFLAESSQTLVKYETTLSGSLIRSAVLTRTLWIFLSFCRFIHTLALILHLLIYLVSLVSLSVINLRILSRLLEVCVTDIALTQEQSFWLSFQLMRIWRIQMVFKWRVTLIKKVSVQSV